MLDTCVQICVPFLLEHLLFFEIQVLSLDLESHFCSGIFFFPLFALAHKCKLN